MDPKVWKTTHTSSERLWCWCRSPPWLMPPPAELRNRPQDGISWIQKVTAVELGFWLRIWSFGVRGYILEEEVCRWSNRGPTRVEGAPWGVGAPPTSWPPLLCLDVGSKSPGSCSLRKSRSQRFHSVWTPFDIPFLQNPEIEVGLRLVG